MVRQLKGVRSIEVRDARAFLAAKRVLETFFEE